MAAKKETPKKAKMVKVLNESARPIRIGGTLLVPGREVEVEEEVAKKALKLKKVNEVKAEK